MEAKESEGVPFQVVDPKAYAEHLARPKQYYPEIPDPSSQDGAPGVKDDGAPANGQGEGAQDPGASGHADQDQEDRFSRKGRNWAKQYSRASSGLLSALCGDPVNYPPSMFALDKDEQEDAAESFAEGMRQGAIPELPWWGGLALVVGGQLTVAVPVVREARRQKRARKAPGKPQDERTAPQAGVPSPSPFTAPSNAQGAQGASDAPDPAPGPGQYVDKETGRVRKLQSVCAHPGCKNRVKKKGRKYCSPEHAHASAPGGRPKKNTR